MRYLYLHGFCSSPGSFKATWFQQRFGQLGIDLSIPDLNLGDFSHLTISGQLDHVRQLILAESGPITLIGSSLGGFLATLAAEYENQVTKMILMAPAFGFVSRYFDRLDPELLAAWRDCGYHQVLHYADNLEHPLHYQFIEDARQYERRQNWRQLPAQVFHGLQDETVPAEVSREYLQQNGQAHLIYLQDDHSLAAELELMWRYMRAFLPLTPE